jgi:hypothetical protein
MGMQTCAVVNVRDQALEYYDSLGGAGDVRSITSLQRWLEDDYQDKCNRPPPAEYQVRCSGACLLSDAEQQRARLMLAHAEQAGQGKLNHALIAGGLTADRFTSTAHQADRPRAQ